MTKHRLSCYDCGMAYGSWPDFHVEAETWAKYSPTGSEGGLLCLNCFAQRMAKNADHRRRIGETEFCVNPIFACKITGTADL